MKRFGILVALLAAALAQPAQAALFTLMGNGSTFTFEIADTPTPEYYFDGVSFVLYDVTAPSASGLVDVTFYNEIWFEDEKRSLQIEDYWGDAQLYELFGPQLYDGAEANPRFKSGRYVLQDAAGRAYNLTIATGTGAVPEPASWAMMIGGFAMAGGVLRRRGGGRTVSFG